MKCHRLQLASNEAAKPHANIIRPSMPAPSFSSQTIDAAREFDLFSPTPMPRKSALNANAPDMAMQAV